MADQSAGFTGSIPENYDRHLGPVLFADYGADLVRRVASSSPTRILETAAGTGIVTRLLRDALPEAHITATDLNPPMLDYAALRQPPDKRIQWQQADAMALPFADESFDLAFCQFGAMFFPDRTQAYHEARRVLKPGGHFLFSVWDRIETNVFADEVTNALARLLPADPPRFLVRTPHGYHDTAVIRNELEAAGFSAVAIDTRTEISRAPSPRHVATAYCQGTLLRNEIEAAEGNPEAAADYVTAALAEKHGHGAIAAKIQAHVIEASV